MFWGGGGYDFDEALRVTGVTLMYEGHTYVFRVSNTGGQFKLMLERHILPGEEAVVCRHVSERHGNPLGESGRDIKKVAYKCIEQHMALCHYLKAVK